MKTVRSIFVHSVLLGLLYLGYGKDIVGAQNVLAVWWGLWGAAYLIGALLRPQEVVSAETDRIKRGDSSTIGVSLGWVTATTTAFTGIWFVAPITAMGALAILVIAYWARSTAKEKIKAEDLKA